MRIILVLLLGIVLGLIGAPIVRPHLEQLLVKPAAANETITLCAGSKGRNYDAVMQSVATELNKRGQDVTVQNLSGSEDILNAVARGTCAAGIAQKDVYWNLSKKNASLGSSAIPKELLYNEAMTLVCTPDSGIDELEDMTGDTVVITDAIGSGSALTWETMLQIEKEYGSENEWSQSQIRNTPLKDALSEMALGNADCAFGVGAVPSAWAKEMEEQGYQVSYIYDKDLNDLIVNKTPLYSSVRVPYGSYTTKFDTYLVPAVLFLSSKSNLDEETIDLIRRVARSQGSKYNAKVK